MNTEVKRKVVSPIVIAPEKKKPEEKKYLVLAAYDVGDEASWKVIIGRAETYNYVKHKIIAEEIDIYESFVLVEGEAFGKEVTVYDFMKYMENFFKDESFNIEDYTYDVVEEVHQATAESDQYMQIYNEAKQTVVSEDSETKDI